MWPALRSTISTLPTLSQVLIQQLDEPEVSVHTHIRTRNISMAASCSNYKATSTSTTSKKYLKLLLNTVWGCSEVTGAEWCRTRHRWKLTRMVFPIVFLVHWQESLTTKRFQLESIELAHLEWVCSINPMVYD